MSEPRQARPNSISDARVRAARLGDGAWQRRSRGHVHASSARVVSGTSDCSGTSFAPLASTRIALSPLHHTLLTQKNTHLKIASRHPRSFSAASITIRARQLQQDCAHKTANSTRNVAFTSPADFASTIIAITSFMPLLAANVGCTLPSSLYETAPRFETKFGNGRRQYRLDALRK